MPNDVTRKVSEDYKVMEFVFPLDTWGNRYYINLGHLGFGSFIQQNYNTSWNLASQWLIKAVENGSDARIQFTQNGLDYTLSIELSTLKKQYRLARRRHTTTHERTESFWVEGLTDITPTVTVILSCTEPMKGVAYKVAQDVWHHLKNEMY